MRYSVPLLIFGLLVPLGAGWAAWVGPQPKSGYPLAAGKGIKISQGFGVPWSENKAQYHTGLDIAAPKDTVVWAMKSGVVAKAGSLGGNWGNYIVVQEDAGTVSAYLHIRTVPGLSQGSRIKAGNPIAFVHKDHLHVNTCYQVAGCQHGAFTNPTFPKGSVGMYYRKPPLSY